jgi:F0F1-type ATP synthase assembly protein I
MGKDADQKDGPAPRTAASPPGAAASRIEALRTAGTVGTVGLSFVVAILIGGALGWWIDNLTGWSPVFFGVFLVLGFLAGIRNVYVIVRRFLR